MSSTRSMQKRILIIGANGLIGRIISQHLSNLGNILYGIDKLQEDEPSPRFQLEQNEKSQLLEKSFPGIFCVADITDEEALRKAIVGFGTIDVVIILAAALENQTPDVIKAVNEEGIRNIYKVCIQESIKRIILASSMMVLWDKYTNEVPYSLIKNNTYQDKYDTFKKITEEYLFVESPVGETEAVAAYKNSKITMEKIAEQYIKESITTICMRVGSVNTQNQPPKEHTWAWTSHNDLCRFIELAVNYLVSPFFAKAQFLPLFLCSDNKLCIVSLNKAKEVIGFVPREGTNKISQQNKIFTPVEDEPEDSEPNFDKRLAAKL